MKLPRAFYLRDANSVAKDLLGKVLVHKTQHGITKGRIVEVESYIGPEDAASHAYKNLRSKRTEIQFGLGGYAYIYLIYGIHYCFNVVVNEVDRPEVILVRALEPVSGLELMKERRQTAKISQLTNGPGKLCSAMGIDKNQYGADLCADSLYIEEDFIGEEIKIVATKRINIDYSGEAQDFLWRYIIEGNSFVSVK